MGRPDFSVCLYLRFMGYFWHKNDKMGINGRIIEPFLSIIDAFRSVFESGKAGK